MSFFEFGTRIHYRWRHRVSRNGYGPDCFCHIFPFGLFFFILTASPSQLHKTFSDKRTSTIMDKSLGTRLHLWGFLFGCRPNSVLEIACFNSKLQYALNMCERNQAKWRECLPRERLGKKHAGKKVLLAGNLIPLLRSRKPCNKEILFPPVRRRRN